MIFHMSDDVTSLNIDYTWWATMNEIIKSVDQVIDKCMVKGETGWPPHSGGIVRRFGGESSQSHQAPSCVALSVNPGLREYADVIHGPLQLSAYGVPEYRKLYDKVGLLDGGFLSGRSPEAEVLMAFIGSKGRPDSSRSPQPSLWSPLTGNGCDQPCSTHQDCPSDSDYLCVANSRTSQDPQLLNACCRSSGSWLLQNSSSSSHGKLVRPGTPPPLALPFSQFGCACNCTYVSQACCGVDDGLVYEPPSLRLGTVQPPNSTSCCDTASGIMSSQGLRSGNSTVC